MCVKNNGKVNKSGGETDISGGNSKIATVLPLFRGFNV